MARMPWGKHRGEDLEDIEASYLLWVLENCDITAGLTRDLKEELAERFTLDGKAEPQPAYYVTLGRELQPLAEEIIKAGYRALVQRVHPDKGGTHEETIRAQAAMEALKQFVAGRKG